MDNFLWASNILNKRLRAILKRGIVGRAMINIRVFALVILFTVVPTQAFPGEWTDWEWIEPSPQGQQLYAVASNHDTVVAVGWSGAIVVSDDGVRWRAQVPIQWKALYDVVWAGDQFIA